MNTIRSIIGTFVIFSLLNGTAALAAEQQCEGDRVVLQVLGSGGPEFSAERASSSYLIWLDDKAAIMVDTGPGSRANFARAGARFENLQAILYSHLHVDHSADLPAFIKGSWFLDRADDLPIYGPAGNDMMPPTSEFVGLLFNEDGAYRYLKNFVMAGDDSNYNLGAFDVPLESRKPSEYELSEAVKLSAVPVHHGRVAALAWRVEAAGCVIVFSGDTSDKFGALTGFAKGADILVAHNAIPEGTSGSARELHMPPSVIGSIAAEAGVSHLVISHRMSGTLGKEADTTEKIRKSYQGPMKFSEDLDCYSLAEFDRGSCPGKSGN